MRLSRREFVKYVTASGIALSLSQLAIAQGAEFPARAVLPDSGRKPEDLIHHIGEDTLVGWAWAPGYGRSAAPGTQKIAGALVEAWVKSGAACPAN